MAHANIWILRNDNDIKENLLDHFIDDYDYFKSICTAMDGYEEIDNVDWEEFQDTYRTKLTPVLINNHTLYQIDIDSFKQSIANEIRKYEKELDYYYRKIKNSKEFDCFWWAKLSDIAYPTTGGDRFIFPCYTYGGGNIMECYHFLIYYCDPKLNLYLYKQFDYHY